MKRYCANRMAADGAVLAPPGVRAAPTGWRGGTGELELGFRNQVGPVAVVGPLGPAPLPRVSTAENLDELGFGS
jgi:hypothetical protein